MAGAGAVAELRDAVTRRRGALVLFVLISLVVIRMTGRAVGLVRGTGPRHLLSVCLVAIRAVHRPAVFARIARASVRVPDRRPARCVVTFVALQDGLEVRGRFACRLRTVVASRAGSGDSGVIKLRRDPSQRRMAIAALCVG